MAIEGQLTIDLHLNGGRVSRADITSTRPLHISALFTGKSASQTLATIPLLFSICAKAQSSAAVQALEQAGGIKVSQATAQARRMVVWAETAREHVLRMALDWPGFCEGQSTPLDVKHMMRFPENLMQALFDDGAAFHFGARVHLQPDRAGALIDGLADFLESDILGIKISRFLEFINIDDVNNWASDTPTIPARLVETIMDKEWSRAGESDVNILPNLPDSELLSCFDQDGDSFKSLPSSWTAAPLETSSLTRQYDTPLIKNLIAGTGAGLLTRLMARLLELASLPEQMRGLLTECEAAETASHSSDNHQITEDSLNSLGHLVGAAQIEAARGRLVHMVELDNGLVQDYRILAPTEWNFHPAGPAAMSLAHLPQGDEKALKSMAKLLITLIDPCVGYEVRIV